MGTQNKLLEVKREQSDIAPKRKRGASLQESRSG